MDMELEIDLTPPAHGLAAFAAGYCDVRSAIEKAHVYGYHISPEIHGRWFFYCLEFSKLQAQDQSVVKMIYTDFCIKLNNLDAGFAQTH